MAFIGLPNVEVCWPSPSYKHVGTNIYLETAVGRFTGYENGITFFHPLFVFPVLPTVPSFRFINRVGRACWTSSLEICIIIFHHFHIITFSLFLSFQVLLFQAVNVPKHVINMLSIQNYQHLKLQPFHTLHTLQSYCFLNLSVDQRISCISLYIGYYI